MYVEHSMSAPRASSGGALFSRGPALLEPPAPACERFGMMVGRSRPMRALFARLGQAATTDVTILLEGETGTGKEVAAASIHATSRRAQGPFIVFDCGAVPKNLLESELFGHEKGAFTGADAARDGVFRAASGGTLFLDEIGELPLDLQPKLLRALEGREIKRVGATRYTPVDVRVVAATNRCLASEVSEKRFRSDLYYRLAVVAVRLPPLRDRLDDLPALVDEILSRLGVRGAREAAVARTPEFLAELAKHAWPGNVRELRNYVERCIALRERAPFDAPAAAEALEGVDLSVPLREAREAWTRRNERAYVTGILARHEGNVAAAARAAGVDRVTFYRLLWRHGLR